MTDFVPNGQCYVIFDTYGEFFMAENFLFDKLYVTLRKKHKTTNNNV